MQNIRLTRIAKSGYITISALMCVVGILMIFMPGLSIGLMGIACGGVMIIFGIVKLVGYFSRDLYRLAFQYDLACGILMIILGIITIFKCHSILNFLCVVVGLLILADGLFKIQTAIDSKHFGIGSWWIILLFAILAGITGLVLLFNANEGVEAITVLMGITFLFEGILNIGTIITAVSKEKTDKNEVIIIKTEEKE